MNYDIVLHVDTDDNCMAVALKNATNYANALPDTAFGMVLLVNGAGVRQLAKTNEAIGDKLAEVMGRGLKVRACANALRDNNLGRAQVCLDAWQQLAPGDAGVRAARLRMAERWVAIGGERLGAGDVAGARAALSRAQVLQPGLPAAADLAGRLERAQ